MTNITPEEALTQQVIEGTPIAFFKQKLTASGIKESVASKCQLTLGWDDRSGYPRIVIPYFNVDAERIKFERYRWRDSDISDKNKVDLGPEQSSGGVYHGKYTQSSKGTPPYWPPHEDQRVLHNDASVPLLVCEGEFKAIAAKSAVLGSGIPCLVVGVGGTSLSAEMLAEFKRISCKVGDIHREVYISMDFNGKKGSKERSEAAEFKLRQLFESLGAIVYYLRWPVPEKGGEQKLDDWLVAGGDLSAAMRISKEMWQALHTERQAILDYLNSKYAILHGSYIPLDSKDRRYSAHDLNTMEGDKSIAVNKSKREKPADIWNLQPKEQRNIVDGLTFRPCPLGQEPELYVWEGNRRCLNVAPHWPRLPERHPMDAYPYTLFLELLLHLADGVQEHADYIRKFIAATARRPHDRPHKVLQFNGPTGTGKSTLFDTIQRFAGDYAKPVGTAFTTKHNQIIEGVIFGVAPDVPVHGKDVDMQTAIKNISGEDTVEINPKFVNPYTIKNYCRLFMSFNKDYLVPIEVGDRRYVVLRTEKQISPAWVAEYKKWMYSPEGLLGLYDCIMDTDLTDFDVHAPGPKTAALLFAQEKSGTQYERFLKDERLWYKDIWSNTELKLEFVNFGYKGDVNNLPNELQSLCPSPQFQVKGAGRCRAIRNLHKWPKDTPHSELRTEWSKSRRDFEGPEEDGPAG